MAHTDIPSTESASTTFEADPELRVRERAYALWEAAGKPHGRDIEYWERAQAMIASEESAAEDNVAEESAAEANVADDNAPAAAKPDLPATAGKNLDTGSKKVVIKSDPAPSRAQPKAGAQARTAAKGRAGGKSKKPAQGDEAPMR